MRPQPLTDLLDSVKTQEVYPDEIIIVDGSRNDLTKEALSTREDRNLTYYKVEDKDRGLTRQRNFGIDKVSSSSSFICFLDDDTILESNYFKAVYDAFESDTEIVGVGGVAINENRWEKKEKGKAYNSKRFYELDGYIVKEGQRNVVRNYLGLQSDKLPGVMPKFSHGRTYSYPLNGKNYEVDLLIGMSFAFRKHIFDHILFSPYFEGYGLYEDADFSIRARQFGKNVICTKAQLNHYHDAQGRPNKYKYGKMVVRNGWYIWRTAFPKPSLKARVKWNTIILVLMIIRFLNVFTTSKRKEALTEAIGRKIGWLSLLFSKPLKI